MLNYQHTLSAKLSVQKILGGNKSGEVSTTLVIYFGAICENVEGTKNVGTDTIKRELANLASFNRKRTENWSILSLYYTVSQNWFLGSSPYNKTSSIPEMRKKGDISSLKSNFQ